MAETELRAKIKPAAPAVATLTGKIPRLRWLIICLVFNAGSLVERLRLLELTEECWDEVIDFNLKSAFLCSKAVAASMIERKSGVIDTPFHEQFSTPETMRNFTNLIPLGRVGKSEEIAPTIVYLASDAASFLIGETIEINGGMLMD